jgi:hypothetical protein
VPNTENEKSYKPFVEKRQERHGVGFLGIYEGMILYCALRRRMKK